MERNIILINGLPQFPELQERRTSTRQSDVGCYFNNHLHNYFCPNSLNSTIFTQVHLIKVIQALYLEHSTSQKPHCRTVKEGHNNVLKTKRERQTQEDICISTESGCYSDIEQWLLGSRAGRTQDLIVSLFKSNLHVSQCSLIFPFSAFFQHLKPTQTNSSITHFIIFP